MKYVEFRDLIENELRQNHDGLTWKELKARLELPYDQPCPSWIKRMEDEIGLSRVRGLGRALVWTINKG
jgi:hypothetical protein